MNPHTNPPSVKPAKHTAGPWRLLSGQDANEIVQPGNGSAHKLIACTSYSPLAQSVCEANARLIAAAPELLEACEAALSCPEVYGTVLAGILTKAVRAAGGNVNPLGTERQPTDEPSTQGPQ